VTTRRGTRRRRTRRDEAGFTLAELVIAISICTLIVGPISMAIIVGLRTTGTSSQRLSQTRDIELVDGVFPRDVFTASQVFVKGQSGALAANTCSHLDSLVVMTWSTSSLVPGNPPTTTPPQTYEVDYVYSLNPLVPPDPQTGSLTRKLYTTGACTPVSTNILASSLSQSAALQTAFVTNNAVTGSTVVLTLTDSTCSKYSASAQERAPSPTTTTSTTPTAPPVCTG
jgi:Tfp pilus assembly major pilin PilA